MKKTRNAVFWGVAISASVTLFLCSCALAVTPITYTLDANFDQGTMVGVEHTTVADQLQLSKETVTLPFIWVPNYDGTVSKLSTDTGKELARYRIAPPAYPSGGNPSRTTVDLNGNCWVGMREAGTVVKIGLLEAGQWVDRNGNGVCDTATDLDNDGNVTGAEILPWGADECVLLEIFLKPGYVGPSVPGAHAAGYGGYDSNYWGIAPRGFAVDADNNIWVGTWSTHTFFKINGDTGDIMTTVNIPYGSYGAVIDANGIIYSAGSSTQYVVRINPNVNPPAVNTIYVGGTTYGLGLDYLGHVFVTGWTESRISRINSATGTLEWTRNAPYQLRGACCTPDNDVWVASSAYGNVYRYNNDCTILKATIYVGNQPTGVAVDANGKVWACNLGSDTIVRIDPATNTVDLVKSIIGSGGHYTYSDMTGIVSRTITTRTGTWTVTYDGGIVGTPWGKITWNQEPQGLEPAGTSIVVKARASDDQATWTPWVTAVNGSVFSTLINGRYIQVEATLKIVSGDFSPILSDLRIEPANQAPTFGDLKYPDITKDEGQIAGNWCKLTDPDGDLLAVNASVGTVVWDSTTGDCSWSFQTTDGPPETQLVTITADDGKGGMASQSFQLTVLNVAPDVTTITAPAVPVPLGMQVNASAPFSDAGTGDTHTAVWDWDDGATSIGSINETNGAGTTGASHTYTTPGVYTIKVTVTDDDGASDESIYQYVVVYDPTAGFVTGGGWIDSPAGACTAYPDLTGKANFGFVSRYKKGMTVPTGNTEFQFHAGDLNFHSENYQWLVVAGYKAMYKGTGTINGSGDYTFIVSAIDGQKNGGGGIDRFRIKIWDNMTGAVVYDNQMGADDNAAAAQAISGGSIVIHAVK